MGSTPFNTATFNIIQLIGVDGATAAAVDNPVPVSLQAALTGSLGAISLAAGTATIGSATIVGALPAGTATIGSATITGMLPAGTNTIGATTRAVTQTATLTGAVISFAASGTTAIVGAVAATSIKVYKLMFTNTTATVITFQNGSTPQSGAMTFPANGALILDNDGEPWFVCATNTAFNLNLSATSQISGRIHYLQN